MARRRIPNAKDENKLGLELRAVGHLPRPDVLRSVTYKIRPPEIDDPVYITISDAEVEGECRPFEIFLNTKDPKSFSWITVTMRLISSRLQEPGPFPDFIVQELLDSYDVGGGYFITDKWLRVPGKPAPRVNGVVAHVGLVLQYHLAKLTKRRQERQH